MDEPKGHLHLVQLRLRTDRLFALARGGRLPLRDPDTGYMVHAALRAVFGEDAPQPFVVGRPDGRDLPVLGYSSADQASLRRRADEFALPEAHGVVDWSRFAGKEMPAGWTPGRRLAFELRACPVVRMSSAGPHHAAGAEVDVFLARCWKAAGPEEPVDREAVYREWLAVQLERQGGARAVGVTVAAFQIEGIMRRAQAVEGRRAARLLRKPDVTFRGELEVRDAAAFHDLLRRGVGRHRAFGFGMLLVRPVASC